MDFHNSSSAQWPYLVSVKREMKVFGPIWFYENELEHYIWRIMYSIYIFIYRYVLIYCLCLHTYIIKNVRGSEQAYLYKKVTYLLLEWLWLRTLGRSRPLMGGSFDQSLPSGCKSKCPWAKTLKKIPNLLPVVSVDVWMAERRHLVGKHCSSVALYRTYIVVPEMSEMAWSLFLMPGKTKMATK